MNDHRWVLSLDAEIPEDVVALDGWRTVIRGPYPEPIKDLQKILGHNVVEFDGRLRVAPEQTFMDYCLTRNIPDPEEFLYDVAARFGCRVPPHGVEQFKILIEHERNNLLLYWDAVEVLSTLKTSGYQLALVSNTWMFPIERLKEQTPLGELLDAWICSYDVNRPKPSPDMFDEVCRRLEVRPQQVVMVGDNLRLDVDGALACGMHAVYLNRDGHPRAAGPSRRNVRVIVTLSELLHRDWRPEVRPASISAPY